MKCLIVSFFAVIGFSLSSIADETSTGSVASAMSDAANKFLETLNADQRGKVVRSFEDSARTDWHNIPKPDRKGLQIRDMNPAQRPLCQELLKAGLSETGYAKAVRIMALESNLKEGEKDLANSPLRDPERYFLSLFGKPATTGVWGWSFEGHHFSLNFVIRDGLLIADSPNFWGANPATVHTFVAGGPDKGTRTLADEEQLAFDIVHSLSESQRTKAVLANKAPAEYRAAGVPQPPKRAAQGLPVKEMTPDQQKVLLQLLTTYCQHLAPVIAAQRLAEIKADGWDHAYFAWEGSTKPGVGHSYRIEAPSFILELVNVQSDPAGNVANHIHSVWRNPKGDFGLPAVN